MTGFQLLGGECGMKESSLARSSNSRWNCSKAWYISKGWIFRMFSLTGLSSIWLLRDHAYTWGNDRQTRIIATIRSVNRRESTDENIFESESAHWPNTSIIKSTHSATFEAPSYPLETRKRGETGRGRGGNGFAASEEEKNSRLI